MYIPIGSSVPGTNSDSLLTKGQYHVCVFADAFVCSQFRMFFCGVYTDKKYTVLEEELNSGWEHKAVRGDTE